jgi:DNA-binding SARP family transcriptional activator
MAVLWPDDDADVARRKLQIAVSDLRHSLNDGYYQNAGGGYLLWKGQCYQLNPAISVSSDVKQFSALSKAGLEASGNEAALHFEKACALYHGPFLVEDLYSDWSFSQRERYTQVYLTMCSALADYYLEIRRYDPAIKWASVVVTENRCDESAYRQLIRAYAGQGRRSEALRQYHRCERVLREELGVPPLPETRRLLETVITS